MTTRGTAPYHHGALREALLEAGEATLEATGIEKFSLREVARRAGVSHAAPAHHFGDADGLLTALATIGYRRFLQAMQARQREPLSCESKAASLVASGLAYVEFASRSPALFRLMFSSSRPNFDDPVLEAAADAAFLHLVADVRHLRGRDPWQDEAAMTDVVVSWALAHGLADLLASKRLRMLGALSPEARERELVRALGRVVETA